MDFLTLLGGAITFGSALGATVAGFFAYRQKSLVTLLRESNKDYKDRVEQLEIERDGLNKRIDLLTTAVKALQDQKALPLENLTLLVTQQYQELHKVLSGIPSQITTTITTTKSTKKGKK